MTDLHKARLVAALLGALTILLVFSDALLPPSTSQSPSKLPAESSPGEELHEGRTGIPQGQFRRRNPFRFVRVHPPPAPPPAQAAPSRQSNLEPVKAPAPRELPLSLVGTISAGPFGMAFLNPNNGKNQLALGPGADLGDSLDKSWKGWILKKVDRKAVTFRKGAEIRVLEIGGTEKGEDSPDTGPPPVVPAAAPASEGQILHQTVDRSEVERARSNLAFLVTQLSVQPFFQAGRPSGVRVSRIRPGSFPARMGVLNGDILQGVNGKPITTLQDTLALNQAFQGSTDVTVNVLRAGSNIQLVYQIR